MTPACSGLKPGWVLSVLGWILLGCGSGATPAIEPTPPARVTRASPPPPSVVPTSPPPAPVMPTSPPPLEPCDPGPEGERVYLEVGEEGLVRYTADESPRIRTTLAELREFLQEYRVSEPGSDMVIVAPSPNVRDQVEEAVRIARASGYDPLSCSELLPSALRSEDVRAVIRANIAELRQCYNAEPTRDPSSAGRVSVRFVISATGSVASTDIVGNTPSSQAAAACVSDRVRTWVFPPPRGGGTVTVTYPYRK